jgi:hypothetical protein
VGRDEDPRKYPVRRVDLDSLEADLGQLDTPLEVIETPTVCGLLLVPAVDLPLGVDVVDRGLQQTISGAEAKAPLEVTPAQCLLLLGSASPRIGPPLLGRIGLGQQMSQRAVDLADLAAAAEREMDNERPAIVAREVLVHEDRVSWHENAARRRHSEKCERIDR